MARMDGSGSGISRRDFLRAAGVAGALGVSGSLLGARAALGHGEVHEASHGAADSGGMAAHGGMGRLGRWTSRSSTPRSSRGNSTGVRSGPRVAGRFES